jgi:CheY-like chemotaxis protein
VFRVRLPLMPAVPSDYGHAGRRHPRGVAPLHAAAFADLRGVRVLVVDDEPDSNAAVQALLAVCGADVRVAGSAAQALETLAGWRPDAVVSDIGMPGEDGYSLIARIRALPPERGGALPAIALTAYARTDDRVRALAAGFQMHLSKPVDPSELAAAIAGLAQRARTL